MTIQITFCKDVFCFNLQIELVGLVVTFCVCFQIELVGLVVKESELFVDVLPWQNQMAQQGRDNTAKGLMGNQSIYMRRSIYN